MIKRIKFLLSLWEQTMIQEQKVLELNAKVFELSIEDRQLSKKIEIMRLELRRKNVLERDKTHEDLEDLEYINEALRILKKEEWDNLKVERKIAK